MNSLVENWIEKLIGGLFSWGKKTFVFTMEWKIEAVSTSDGQGHAMPALPMPP